MFEVTGIHPDGGDKTLRTCFWGNKRAIEFGREAYFLQSGKGCTEELPQDGAAGVFSEFRVVTLRGSLRTSGKRIVVKAERTCPYNQLLPFA